MSIAVVIINYNYERYVARAIQSVLKQTRAVDKLIIVDDGSTDDSLSIIRSEVMDTDLDVLVLEKSNGGMISAANEAFEHVESSYVLFLDADDAMDHACIDSVSPQLANSPALLHFPLKLIDEFDKFLGTFPNLDYYELSYGDDIDGILECGFYVKSSTSGNIYKTRALRNIFPITDHQYGSSSDYHGKFPLDAYLTNKVLLFGAVVRMTSPYGFYRMHDKNNGAKYNIWGSERKRIRTLALVLNDIRFFSEHGMRDVGQKLLRDPRIILNYFIQQKISHNKNFHEELGLGFKEFFISIRWNCFNKKMRLSHKFVIYILILIIQIVPRRPLMCFIK